MKIPSFTLQRPDFLLSPEDKAARREREQQLPAEQRPTRILGVLKLRKPIMQSRLQDALARSSDPLAGIPQVLHRWAAEDSRHKPDSQTCQQIVQALTTAINSPGVYRDESNTLCVPLNTDFNLPQSLLLELGSAGVKVIRPDTRKSSGAPVDPIATGSGHISDKPTALPKAPIMVPKPSGGDGGNAVKSPTQGAPTSPASIPARLTGAQRIKADALLNRWKDEPAITNEERAQRTRLVQLIHQGLDSGGNIDLSLIGLGKLRSLPALPEPVTEITLRPQDFSKEFLDELGKRKGLRIIEVGAENTPVRQPVSAANETTGGMVPMTNSDEIRSQLRNVLVSWATANDIDAGESELRMEIATQLTRSLSKADPAYADGTYQIPVAENLSISDDQMASLASSGIRILRTVPAMSSVASGSGTPLPPTGVASSSSGASNIASGAQIRRRPLPVPPRPSSMQTPRTPSPTFGAQTPVAAQVPRAQGAGSSSSSRAGTPPATTEQARSPVMRPLITVFGPALASWSSDSTIGEEERARRQGAAREVRTRQRGRQHLDLSDIGNFSSLPPIPHTISQVTTSPGQFPEEDLSALRSLGVHVLVSDERTLKQ